MRGPLAVISPHLDDAVLGCGALLAAMPGAIVITVFAGRPPADAPLRAWDAAAGFSAGDDVIGIRRAEDAAALRCLGAEPLWLPFLDAQYEQTPSVDEVAEALDGVLCARGPATVCIPLGLFHSDHALAHAAALEVRARHRSWGWLAYEEPMYRRVPGALADRLEALRKADISAIPLPPRVATVEKRDAIACYASQLRALATPGRPGHADALAEERQWKLLP
ncbi:MAG TPA: PIG-L family deacetylase [Methylomirabilota bacterium]|nr:PIG-L family deacetylase [Methylomirabilota bacterium]